MSILYWHCSCGYLTRQQHIPADSAHFVTKLMAILHCYSHVGLMNVIITVATVCGESERWGYIGHGLVRQQRPQAKKVVSFSENMAEEFT